MLSVSCLLCIVLYGLRIRHCLTFSTCQRVIPQVEIFGPILEDEHDDKHNKHCQEGNGWIENEQGHLYFKQRFLAFVTQQILRRRAFLQACELLLNEMLEIRDQLHHQMHALLSVYFLAFPNVRFLPKKIYFN